jgi:DNA-binding NarL/FixJ family response regulator
MALSKPIRVLIADDHQLFRNGVTSIFEDVPDILIVGEAENGTQLIDKYFILQPDLILVDISMPDMNGLDALKEIKKKDKNVKAIFLTMHDSEEYVIHAFKIGAMGLVSKNTIKGELVYAIKTAFNGEKYFGKQYDETRLKQIEHNYKKLTSEFVDDYIHLTVKERQILECVSKGQTSQEIANQLELSKRSIDHYRSRMMTRLNLKGLPEFISYAIKYTMTNKILGKE